MPAKWIAPALGALAYPPFANDGLVVPRVARRRASSKLPDFPGMFEWWHAGLGVTTEDDGGVPRIASWVGQKQGRVIAQANVARRPKYVHASLNDKPTTFWDGNYSLVSQDPASDWSFLHAGTLGPGGTILAVARVALVTNVGNTYTMFSTKGGAFNSRGVLVFYIHEVGMQNTTRTGVGTGTTAYGADTSNHWLPTEWQVSAFRTHSAVRLYVAGVAGNSQAIDLPNPNAPANTFHLGCITDTPDSAAFRGEIADIVALEEPASSDTINAFALWAQEEYGIVTPAI